MFFKLKNAVLVLVVCITGWISLSAYNYFFDTRIPEVVLSGLNDDDYYSGDAQCGVASNKRGEISVWLDEKPLINRFRVSSVNQEQPFTIPTKTISNGKHTLKVEFVDKTYRKNKVVLDRAFNVDNTPLQAAFVRADSEYKVFQGRTLHVQFQVNKEIKKAHIATLSNTYPCFPESKGSSIYESYIPITCEENPSEYLFTACITDHVGNALNLENKFQVVMYPFKKQIIEISPEKIQQERQEATDSNAKFDEILETLAQQSPQEKLWKGAFCNPIDIAKVTCEFGTVRTTQHKGRYAHKALDLINKPKSVVWSSQDGVVALKDRYEASGNTVIVDHGFGVLSMYYHLENFANIKVGDKIAKGNPVGTIGKTGYATGYHLHWEMRVNNVPVDPAQWTHQTF
ncbi:MAG: M23 family metallopeptidase [Candidatus Dependentiae bacterium]|nr:M23 family metallopeptidase [Candidatus Dependentiae bacterium]